MGDEVGYEPYRIQNPLERPILCVLVQPYYVIRIELRQLSLPQLSRNARSYRDSLAIYLAIYMTFSPMRNGFPRAGATTSVKVESTNFDKRRNIAYLI